MSMLRNKWKQLVIKNNLPSVKFFGSIYALSTEQNNTKIQNIFVKLLLQKNLWKFDIVMFTKLQYSCFDHNHTLTYLGR